MDRFPPVCTPTGNQTRVQKSRFMVLSSQQFKYFIPLSSYLHGFWGKVGCNLILTFTPLCKVYPKVSSHLIWKIEAFIEEDTRYKKHCTWDTDSLVPFKVGILGPHTVLPVLISCPFIFSWVSSVVWNLFPFRGDFSFGKSQKPQGTNLDYQRIWCFAKILCVRRDAWAIALLSWSCLSPVAHTCILLNHPNNFHGWLFKLNAKFDAD